MITHRIMTAGVKLATCHDKTDAEAIAIAKEFGRHLISEVYAVQALEEVLEPMPDMRGSQLVQYHPRDPRHPNFASR